MARTKKVIVVRTKEQEEEWEKCKNNPIYFIENYCYISNPVLGTFKFKLYPFQKDLIVALLKDENRLLSIVKSRQMGISTVMSAFSMWLINFYPAKSVATVATDLSTAQELHEKIKFMYENLPQWMAQPYVKKNQKILHLKNNSRARAYSHNKNKGVRSLAGTLIIMDESAFIEGAEKLFRTIQPSLRTGGQLVALSSPDLAEGWFYDIYTDGINGVNNFATLKLPWYLHPDQQLPDGSPDWEWRKQQDKELGKRGAKMEYDAEFGYSDDTYFDVDYIEKIEKTQIREPIRKEGKLWIWEDPLPNEEYIATVDVSEGLSQKSDNHVVDVYKVSTMEQVAQYCNNEHYTVFGYVPVQIASTYKNALLVIEANSVGTAVLQRARDLNYNNIYMRGVDKRELQIIGGTKQEYGWKTTPKTRPIMLETMRSYIETEEGGLIFRSTRTLKEIKSFKLHSGKAQATSSKKDDTVMTGAMFSFIYSIYGMTIKAPDDSALEYLKLLAMVNENTNKNYQEYVNDRKLNHKIKTDIFNNNEQNGIDDVEKFVEEELSQTEHKPSAKLNYNIHDRRLRKEFNWLK